MTHPGRCFPIARSAARDVRAGDRCVRGWQRLFEGFDLVAFVAGDEADAGALCERRHDLAAEAEDGSLVRGTVADDEGAAAVGQVVEDAAECGAELLRVLRNELGVGLA
jgi:hypothetical protein